MTAGLTWAGILGASSPATGMLLWGAALLPAGLLVALALHLLMR